MPRLRAVPDPERVPEVPATVAAAAASSHRDLLVALRDRIASDIDAGVPPRDLASLSRRLMELSAEIEKIDAEGGGAVGKAAGRPDAKWEAI